MSDTQDCKSVGCWITVYGLQHYTYQGYPWWYYALNSLGAEILYHQLAHSWRLAYHIYTRYTCDKMLDLYLNVFVCQEPWCNWVVPVWLTCWELNPGTKLLYPNYFAVLRMFLQAFSHCLAAILLQKFMLLCVFLREMFHSHPFLLLGYNFVLSACDKSMKWQHALEIFTTLKSKRLGPATLYLGIQTWAPWRRKTTTCGRLEVVPFYKIASTSWRGWYVDMCFLHFLVLMVSGCLFFFGGDGGVFKHPNPPSACRCASAGGFARISFNTLMSALGGSKKWQHALQMMRLQQKYQVQANALLGLRQIHTLED